MRLRRWTIIITILAVVALWISVQSLRSRQTIAGTLAVIGAGVIPIGAFVCLFFQYKVPAVIEDVLRSGKPICPGCGYSLEGLPDHANCPECGAPYEFEAVRTWWRNYRSRLLASNDPNDRLRVAGRQPVRAWWKLPAWNYRPAPSPTDTDSNR